MKFYDNNAPSQSRAGANSSLKRRPNYFIVLAAILAAIIMWYYVSKNDRIEAQLEVNIDYTGIPQNLVVTEGLVNKLVVRLRGPEMLLRSLLREKRNDVVDLSNIKKGETIVPFGLEKLGGNVRAFDIVDIQPPRIVVKADNLIERSVPVRTEIDSPLRNGALTVENVVVQPGTVILRGPEEVLSHISYIRLPIRPDPRTAGTRENQTVTLDTPSLVTSSPSTVRVSYTITSGRAIISREYNIEIAGDSDHNYKVEPKTVALMVEVPDALSKNSKYLQQVEVSVVPPPMEGGDRRKVRIKVRVPEGMTLINQTPQDAELTRNKK